MAKKAVKRGRKLGVKVGPYKMSISGMSARIKALELRVNKLEKVLS
jgi:hypothetical protein